MGLKVFHNLKSQFKLVITTFFLLALTLGWLKFTNLYTIKQAADYNHLNQHSYRGQIILFGDSITQRSFNSSVMGFGAQLSDFYQRRYDVINRGFSGYNTRLCLEIFQDIIGGTVRKVNPEMELVVIFLGANDAVLPDDEKSWQHVPLEEYSLNLESMIRILNYNFPKLQVLLTTPPPMVAASLDAVGNSQTGYLYPKNRNPTITRLYRNEVMRLGYEFNIPVFDTWAEILGPGLEYDRGLVDKYFLDGLHYSSMGNIMHFEGLKRTIAEVWPSMEPYSRNK